MSETTTQILERMSDAFFSLNEDSCFSKINRSAENMLGYHHDQLVGRSVWDVITNEFAVELRQNLKKAISEGHSVHFEWFFPCRERWYACQIYPQHGNVSTYFHDITDHKKAEQALSYQANHDALTGLPNRSLLLDRLEQILSRAPWHDRFVAVLFFNLDRFTFVNDTLGHRAGDLVITTVASRLTSCVRDGDTIARVGGDEFVVVLVDVANTEDVQIITQRFLNTLAQPLNISGQELFVTASMGVSLYPNDGREASVLMEKASTAMHRAKVQGENTVALYAPTMSIELKAKLALERELRQAISKREFVLYYQPILELSTGDVVGSEVLIRWIHKEHGVIGPDKFLSVAEDCGLILAIGEWVLRTACQQQKQWNELGFSPMTVAVNLSNRQFKDVRLVDIIRSSLNDAELSATQLELELTENIIMDETDAAIESLHELRTMGIKVSIDDFGTGYSSLASLKRFPLDCIKVDRSFVSDISQDKKDAAIANAIITMSRQMNLKTIAEGVETQEQLDILIDQGCDRIQGYFLGRPVPAESYTEFLSEWRETPHLVLPVNRYVNPSVRTTA